MPIKIKRNILMNLSVWDINRLQVMKLNIAVCDDEKIIREQIKGLLEKQEQNSLIELYVTGDELLASGKSFDIVFLDIQMDGKNGIETAKALREKNAETILIFITGLREYVFEAFDVAAFHYLLKPIEECKFVEVFLRAKRELERRKKKRQEPLFIKTGKRSITLEKRNILYVESMGKKVGIHTINQTIEAYASMNELEGQLGGSFYRCHRGYLVNLAYVAEYNRQSITLNNGECIYLSKERYGEFVKTYMRFLRNEVGADV